MSQNGSDSYSKSSRRLSSMIRKPLHSSELQTELMCTTLSGSALQNDRHNSFDGLHCRDSRRCFEFCQSPWSYCHSYSTTDEVSTLQSLIRYQE